MILTTPRSGSYLLSEALTNTGLAGHPNEYFGIPQREEIITKANISDEKTYLEYLFQNYSTENGVFGIKTMWRQMCRQAERLKDIPHYGHLPLFDLIKTIFPNLHFVWIKRHNILRQAISYSKALQTDIWAVSGSQNEVIPSSAVFDIKAITDLIHQIEDDEKCIQDFFVSNSIVPFTVIYEDFTEAYEETALQILDYLKIEIPENITFGKRRLKRQANAETDKWIQLYRNYFKE